MVKKKMPTLQELLDRPWCYYCERDFDDNKVLQDHQRAKHFRCHRCNRRLNTINGLRVHTEQVHKAAITEVENCTVPSRNVIEREIFGMEGIPTEILDAHRTRVTNEFFKRENEWKLKTGNPIQGDNPNQKKRTHEEDPEAFKARLEEHKKKRRAERAAKAAGVPLESIEASASPPGIAHPQPKDDGVQPGAVVYSAPNTGAVPSAYIAPPSIPNYGPGPAPYPPSLTSPPPAGAPLPPTLPFHHPGLYGQPPLVSVGNHPYPSPVGTFPGGAYPPPPVPGPFNPPFGAPRMVSPVTGGAQISAPPPPFNTVSPSPGSMNATTTPTALPSRPSFDTPNVSREDMEKMHAGHHHGTGNNHNIAAADPGNAQAQSTSIPPEAIDDLIAEVTSAKSVPAHTTSSSINQAIVAPSEFVDKSKDVISNESGVKKKKNKAKRQLPPRRVFTNEELCPEELLASSSKFYKYINGSTQQQQTTIGPRSDAVTGAVDEALE